MTPLKHFQSRKHVNMSIHAELILDLIRSMGDPSVMRVIDNGVKMRIATRMTLHRSLTWLKSHGYVTIEPYEGDRRSKYCKLTTKGTKYFS